LLLALFVLPVLVNTLCELGTAYLLNRTEQTGRAASLFLLWPSLILSAPVAQKESLALLLATGLFFLAIERGRAWMFGLVSGLLLLTQPALILLPPALALFLVRGEPLRWYLAVAAVAVLVLLPWWLRNWLVFGAFVPLTSSGGLSLAFAVNGGHLPPIRPDLPEIERFALQGRIAWDSLNPPTYVAGQAKQAFLAFFRDSNALLRIHPEAPLPFVRAVQAAWLGLLVAALRCRDRLVWLGLLAGVVALLPVLPLEFGERHRMHLLPLLCLAAFSRGLRPVRAP
jgi:hypothetical protein